MDVTNIDRTKLSDMQRRNLAAWQLKQYELKQQYGDRIRIVNTIDDILSMTRPLTIPISALDPGKQLSIMMEELREDADGSVSLVHERGEMPIADSVTDITLALEAKVDEYRKIDEMRTMRKRKKEEFQVPKGYKLVKMDDTEDIPVDVVETGSVVEDTIGVSIPKSEKLVVAEDKNEAIKQLLDLLI